jgi:hypothetical protein
MPFNLHTDTRQSVYIFTAITRLAQCATHFKASKLAQQCSGFAFTVLALRAYVHHSQTSQGV